MKVAALFLLAGVLIATVPAYAHHSFAATYNEKKLVTVEGNVTGFFFRNPHCFVHLETTESDGKATEWAVEWFSAGRLGSHGITADTFKAGDHVIITGAPGLKDGEHKIHLKTIVRPSDGLKYDNSAVGYNRRAAL
jgi:hypothetical protein